MLAGKEPNQCRHGNHNRHDARQDRRADRSSYRGSAIPVLEQPITEHQDGKSAMPDHVKPNGCLQTGVEKPGRREQVWKAQGVSDCRDGGEEVSTRQQQERPRPQDTELRKQQDCGDEIDDRERGLIACNERRNLGQRRTGKRHGANEQNRRDADYGQRSRAFAARRRQCREKDITVVCVHHRLPRTGI
jgi:hypothetical protein